MGFDLKEEIRDDYLVDEKHKKIWSIEIALLKEVIRICDKYNLTYFVYGGTLLGAVRHKGFIPWDDDLDIAMFRKDYEIFMEKAQEELDETKFCLQKSEQFGVIYEGFARLRDNFSTAIIKKDCLRDSHHGIYIDIFPLDKVIDNGLLRKIQFTKIKLLSTLIFYKVNQDNSLSHKSLKNVLNHIGNEKVWEWLTNQLKKTCMKYNSKECKTVGILSCDPYDWKCYWYWEDIKETIEMPYEDFLVDVPKGYERCLRIGYGAYEEFPPVEERGTWHQDVFFDPDKPYYEYTDRKNLFEL